MALLQSRRLEGLLGCTLESVTAVQVRALVDLQAVEAFDLDFKSTMYGGSDSEKRNLSGDVAALANTAGGLIIIGISEDDQARAASAPGVEVSDADVARIRQVVAAGVSPLPAFDVINVHDDESPGKGFVLIAVPRSVLAPHAVLINEALRFPTRNGSTTRYLSEPELAAAYRARLAGASERHGRLDLVEADLRSRLKGPPAEDAWIVVTLVPEMPGEFALSQASFVEFESTARNTRIGTLGDRENRRLHRFEVGHQRLRADDSNYGDGTPPYGVATELHTDGAGAIALRMFEPSTERAELSPYAFSDEGLAESVAWSLDYLARHSRDRAHAGGMAEVRVRVIPARHRPGSVVGTWLRGVLDVRGRVLASPPPPVSTFALIEDLAEGGTGLIAAAARLHHAIGHTYGYPELPQLTLDGELVWANWQGARRGPLKEWADQHGVPILCGH